VGAELNFKYNGKMNNTHDTQLEMIRCMDDAVFKSNSTKEICSKVKSVLEEWVNANTILLDSHYLEPEPNSYARRLLHRDPEGRYSIAVMVWGQGQGTPIHDHAGLWCVECVYSGLIKVDSYSMQGLPEDEVVNFKKMTSINAGCGSAGSLIPPFDYHTISNAQPTPSVTMHVYGGDMNWCNIYQEKERGKYEKIRRELSFSS
tara:strand:- start:1315 stop:1923 length:609 start_codon:yes stop_codon:yes gene_type:complete